MKANITREETEILDRAIAWLQVRLPKDWTVSRSDRTVPAPDPTQPPLRVDGAIDLKGPQGTLVTFVMEARRSFQPRDVESIVPPGVSQTLRKLGNNTPIIVAAPWLSQRTQELLTAADINFLDLTGNARITLQYPLFYFQTSGEKRDPNPRERPAARVRGPKAARLIRMLVDVAPPYGVREISQAAKLNPGYVSRLLDTLDRDALIDRSTRGQVINVDVANLIERWAFTYEVFKTNTRSTYLAPRGAADALAQLKNVDKHIRIAVTGSFAAVTRAPVAAPAFLLVYCNAVEEVANRLELLPASSGSNVALLTPFDDVVWQRTKVSEGVTYVSESQAAVDCLTGNGRMPAEGKALINWMTQNEPLWRAQSLDEIDFGGDS